MRHWFPITREWVKWRVAESILIAEEDAAIRTTRDKATGELRAFMDRLIAERERGQRIGQRDSNGGQG